MIVLYIRPIHVLCRIYAINVFFNIGIPVTITIFYADPRAGGRRGSAVADAAVPAGAVLCGRFGSLERCALHKDCAGCINASAAAWLNCSKQHPIPRENSTKAKKYENDLLIFWQTLESLAVLV